MPIDDVFGPVVTGSDVEQAVEATLAAWMPSVTRMLGRLYNRTLEPPKGYTVVNEFAQIRGMQMPACVIVSTGTGEPSRNGDGTYDADFAVGVAVIVKAATREDANALAKLYAEAVSLIVAQNGSLGGFAAGVDLGPQSYTDIDPKQMETAGACTVAFTVRVAHILDSSKGPATPPVVDPPPPFPHVTSVDIDVERQELP